MTLQFDKNQDGDISICIYDGSLSKPFSYIELISRLMAKENIESAFTESINEDEKKQIIDLLVEIKEIVSPSPKDNTSI